MTSHDTLVLIAELAVAIAGFSSLIVALERENVRNWSTANRLNLRILLQVSAVAIFFSLFPLIFERVVPQPSSWRWALWVYGLYHVVDVSSFIFWGPSQVQVIHRVATTVGLLIAMGSLVAAAFGSLLFVEVYYISMLVWHLGVAAMGFALLIFGGHGDDTV